MGQSDCPGEPSYSIAQVCAHYDDRPADEECVNDAPNSSKVRYEGPYDDEMTCGMLCS